ncbi:HvfC family RiPP maturation protein [Pseudoalteromonas sp. T1lg65]|uniref:HvfC family RiPP maturation protein n=1 Tax=Pseudoalteromonas sp. T1lg65 TaxID=2077101 RepID=UPI003F791532
MSFKETQRQFMAYIRDPENQPMPQDIEARRMKIYTELFFNNVEGFVATAFPVLKSLYTESNWMTLVRAFFSKHNCQSPHFVDISKEFLIFLQSQYEPKDSDPVFLQELAHYEWLELHVATKIEDQNESQHENLSQPLYLSSVANIAHYQYPVHLISPDFQPAQSDGNTYSFVIYRDQHDDVQFIALNAMTALLLSFIDENSGIYFDTLIAALVEQLPQFPAEQLTQGAKQTLSQFSDFGIVVAKN